MPCRKQLVLSSACPLEDCETADQEPLPATDYMREYSMAYSSDHCYSCFLSYNNPVNTTTKWNKYEPATNTVVEKATYAGLISGHQTFDAKHGVFVSANGDRVFLFDPVTETLTSFTTGVTGAIFDLFYVPEKELTYGHIGEDGTGQHYIGYIDLDLQIAVQLGVIPTIVGANPFGYNLVYSPVADAIYGAWQAGIGSGLLKFDLDTNVGSEIVAGTTGIECCWDSDQNYLVICAPAGVSEWDTDTDTLARFTAGVGGVELRWTPFYVSTLTKVFATGYDALANLIIASFNTDTATFTNEKSDFQYYGISQFKNGSFLSSAYDNGTAKDGVRRLCLT